MDDLIQKRILATTSATKIVRKETIQPLWSDFGKLQRIYLEGGETTSVILKHILIPEVQNHPKGFSTDRSKQRKIRSYQVETEWYQNFNTTNLKDKESMTPRCLDAFQREGEFFILLEDLDNIGYTERHTKVGMKEAKVVLSWLASFHAKFMQIEPTGLWPVGTYWHLETRPDELALVKDERIKSAAPLIDQRLHNMKHQTLVHGDAKLANFCFTKDLNVAAVDFQYVGRGCGMKDVAYFVGSCFDEERCEKTENEILNYYFDRLRSFLDPTKVDFAALEREWRDAYRVAWADFTRFLLGWNPTHQKIHRYSRSITEQVVDDLHQDLLSTARTACQKAGTLILSRWKTDFKVSSKEGNSPAATVVTEVDFQAQQKILTILDGSMTRYGLGLLAEESVDDKTRLEKDFFWAIDPLDGTKRFSEGQDGFAVSIALVRKDGQTEIAAMYNPVSDQLFHAVRGQGAFINNCAIEAHSNQVSHKKIQLFADESLKEASYYDNLQEVFDIHFVGGAVVNVMNIINCRKGIYFKLPKKSEGGCAIWDLAASAILLEEVGGVMTDLKGNSLSFNNPETIYFHKTGFIAASDPATFTEALACLRNLGLMRIAIED